MTAFPVDAFLLTLQPFDRTAGARVTLYVSNCGYRTDPGDALANVYFVDALAGFRFERNAFRPGNVGGSALPGRLSLTLRAAALSQAERVAWLGYAWAGHPFTLERVPAGSAYADRETVGRGTMQPLEQSAPDTFVLPARDPGEGLAVPLQGRLYPGTGGFGGTVELQGRPRPVVLAGQNDNVEGVIVDPALLWVDLHDGPIVAVHEVRDNGAPLSLAGSSSPAAGEYWPDLVRGRVQLGSSPVGAITADVTGAAGYSNLLPRSEDFTTWTAATTGGVVLTVAGDAATAPDGTASADTLTASGGVSGTASAGRLVTVADTVHALSVHAEAAAGDWLLLAAERDDDAAGGRFGAYFNVATGEVGSTIAAAGASEVQAYMLPLPAGGYRCVVSGELPSGMTSLRCRVALAGADAGETFTAAGQSLAVWGAMLNEGAVAAPYVATAAAAVAVAAPETLGQVLRYVLGRFAAILYPSGFDTARMTALDTSRPGAVGRAIGTEAIDISTLFDQLVGGANCVRWFTRAGLFACAAFDPPAATAADDAAVSVVLTADDVRRGSVRKIVPGIPPWRIVPSYRVRGVVQAADQLAGSVTAANRLKWSTAALTAPPIEDRAVLRAYPGAPTLPLVTYAVAEADATAIGETVAVVLEGLAIYRAEAKAAFGTVELAAEAWFEHAEYGHAAGVAAVVLGSVEEMRGLVQLEIGVIE